MPTFSSVNSMGNYDYTGIITLDLFMLGDVERLSRYFDSTLVRRVGSRFL